MRARFVGPVRGAAGVALALILLVGGFIFYNTNVLNAFGASDESEALRTEYEKRFGRFEKLAQPVIESARLRVEIHPDDPAVEVNGSFQLGPGPRSMRFTCRAIPVSSPGRSRSIARRRRL